MALSGIAYKFGNNINTDLIISGRYKFSIQEPKELARHIMEDLQPHFYSQIRPGESFVVAGENFGCGSSREQAPLALKEAGILAIIAQSFARIFYRNAFNIGLPLIECDTEGIDNGDKLQVNLEKGKLLDLTKSIEIEIRPLPAIMCKLWREGGVIGHLKKYGRWHFET